MKWKPTVSQLLNRIQELEQEVEKQKQMRLNALRRIEELEPKLNDELHDAKVRIQELEQQLEYAKIMQEDIVARYEQKESL